MHDAHAHSNYSDGRFLPHMVEAAVEAGLEGVGIADHCVVSDRDRPREARARWGFTLDRTYGRRRRAIESIREEVDFRVFDAVEMDYDPRDEEQVAAFLDKAGFDYAVGSVHVVGDENVQRPTRFRGRSASDLDRVVDRYFEKLVALVESELFAVAAHPDLVERTEPLRGRATVDQYERVARVFADSRTIPEVNAGRALSSGVVHPDSDFLETLLDHDVPVAVGTDSHRPGEIGERVEFLEDFIEERGLEPVTPPFGSD